jgi:hypothetical protein
MWRELRDETILPAVHEAVRARANSAELTWLRAAWKNRRDEGDVVEVELDGALAGLLIKCCRSRSPHLVDDLAQALMRAGLDS